MCSPITFASIGSRLAVSEFFAILACSSCKGTSRSTSSSRYPLSRASSRYRSRSQRKQFVSSKTTSSLRAISSLIRARAIACVLSHSSTAMPLPPCRPRSAVMSSRLTYAQSRACDNCFATVVFPEKAIPTHQEQAFHFIIVTRLVRSSCCRSSAKEASE